MKNLLAYFFCISFLLFSCSESNTDIENIADIDTECPITYQAQARKEPIFLKHSFDNKQLLGAGYDITDEYLSNEAVKAPIFDYEKIATEHPDWIIRLNANVSEPINYVGKDANALLRHMAYLTDIESFYEKPEEAQPLFAGTIMNQSLFATDYGHSSQYSFAICEQCGTHYRMYLYPFWTNNRYLEQYLCKEFQEDLIQLNAEQIVGKYGTHILKDIGLGLRYTGMYRACIPTATSDEEKENIILISALTEMQTNGLPINNLIGGYEDKAALSIGGQLVVEFYGGDMSKLSEHPTNEEVKSWCNINETDETDYALTKIYNQALPLYEVVADETKKSEIKAYIAKQIEEQSLKLTDTTPLLQAWNGKRFFCSTSYDAYVSQTEVQYQGAVCSLFTRQVEGSKALYQYTQGEQQRLSLTPNEENKESGKNKSSQLLGYIYPSAQAGTVPLYEVSNGSAYYYTTHNRETYDTPGKWKQVGIVGHVMPF